MNKLKIEFIEDAFYDGKLAHLKGSIAELDEHMAHRWIKRGKAIASILKPEINQKVEEAKSLVKPKSKPVNNSQQLANKVIEKDTTENDL